jgi:4-diphosphocytidyl-2-C-methyl-D-erythritol kinase
MSSSKGQFIIHFSLGKRYSMAVVKESYAKINLILKILDRRPDGYHNLVSLFQRIDLRDELSFDLRENGIEIGSNLPDLPLDHANLVYRAAEMLLKKSGENRGVKIFIRKNIPIGAGLGGGSSNAATTLQELNRLWGLHYSIEELASLGGELGSDIPFFCYGCSTAWVSGRGETVEPLHLTCNYRILLVFPGFSVKTSEAYRQWDLSQAGDKNNLTKGANHNKILSFQTVNSGWLSEYLENDFEKLVFGQYPLLQEMKARLLGEKAEKVLLSGSGSTLLGFFSSENLAGEAERNLRRFFPAGWIKSARCL